MAPEATHILNVRISENKTCVYLIVLKKALTIGHSYNCMAKCDLIKRRGGGAGYIEFWIVVFIFSYRRKWFQLNYASYLTIS